MTGFSTVVQPISAAVSRVRDAVGDHFSRGLDPHSVEHDLHTVNNPLSLVAGAVGATAPLLMVPTAVYLGSKHLLRDTPGGSGAATSIGLATSGLVEGSLARIEAREGAGRLAHLASGTSTKAPWLTRSLGGVASFLGKAIPVAVIAGGAWDGVNAVHSAGNDLRALVDTPRGRDGVLRGIGGAMLLTPLPVVKLASAVPLVLAAANSVGAFSRFDRPGTTVTAATPH